MRILYSIALGVAAMLTAPWWLWRMLRAGKYRVGLSERLGAVPERLSRGEAVVWVHAVSVGEVLAMSTTIAHLRAAGRRVVVSTTTATGQALARERFGAENVFHFPLDFAFAVRPYLRALRPALVVLAETEFWPNFLRLAKASGARVAVVNARISDRSFPRYRRFRGLLGGVLRHVDVFLAQTEEDARRLREVGADPSRVSVAGNLKFDVKPAADIALVPLLRDAFERDHAGPVVVAGSTLAGEEEIVLRSFAEVRRDYPQVVLVLAPRHPERFAAVAALLDKSGIPWQRRSQWRPGAPLPKVLLLDTIGELAAIYQLADIAFVGGSLVPAGGHNVVEPARFGVPVVVGPHNQNFREIVDVFDRAGALTITGESNLGDTWRVLLRDQPRRAGLGQRAAEVVRQNAGATAKIAAALDELLGSAQSSSFAPASAARTAATPISPDARS